jgi:hypothetical protein
MWYPLARRLQRKQVAGAATTGVVHFLLFAAKRTVHFYSGNKSLQSKRSLRAVLPAQRLKLNEPLMASFMASK